MARTTIREVSDRAGVSIGTVSNVLNAPHLVADPTKA
ncbi:MAG TPA: LacI family DNA-binding transcriptional regulator, partial [Acidimicrobiia bacterium]|nr:LacI family DNA-binding transcriptional regulator [Acidimicrobiia bacterium]